MSARELRPYQFSLKSLFWIGLYVVVLAKSCTMMVALGFTSESIAWTVFLFHWTGAILAHLACSIWAWSWLRGQSTAARPEDDLTRRFWASLAWGTVPLLMWLASLRPPADRDLIVIGSIVSVHFLPLVLTTHLPYLFGLQTLSAAPLRAMRLFSLLAYLLPVLAGVALLF
jgi:hypothetical protein